MVTLSTQLKLAASPRANGLCASGSLHHEHRFGSLEAGKGVDVVLCNDAPLDLRSLAEVVLIEGRIQYDLHLEGRQF